MLTTRAVLAAALALVFLPAHAEIAKLHFVFLKATGKENRDGAEDRMKRHLAYLEGLWNSGQALAIGPTDDGGDIRGFQILKTENPIQALAWANGDPMVQEGVLRPVVFPWWTDLASFQHKGAFMDLGSYTLSLLYAPADRPRSDGGQGEQLQAGHMSNIRKMGQEGHLLLAGPFESAHRFRGLFVFQGTDRRAIEEWTRADPLIAGGYLKMFHYHWLTSKGNFASAAP